MENNKRDIILDAMLELLKEGRAGTASVSDIARQANIAKGGMYYYFSSKQEVLDALVEREYESIIERCRTLVESFEGDALLKLALLLESYRSSFVESSLDQQLHADDNASIHQRSLSKILLSLTPIVSNILEQGVREGQFKCEYPDEYAEIILSVFCFLLDYGIFTWTPKQIELKVKALSDLLEKGLGTPAGSFSFLWKGY